MRLPLWVALFDPKREPADFARLDLARAGTLSFEALDESRFPCVRLAIAAGRQGGTTPAVLNAANEIAVAAFLEERIRYVEIPAVIEATLDESAASAGTDLDAITAADARARRVATRHVEARAAAVGGRRC